MTHPSNTSSGESDERAAVTPSTLRIGGKYNLKYQAERLVYMGLCEPRNGRWHQFALVEAPTVCWCEVRDEDLSSFEETRAALATQPAESKACASVGVEPTVWQIDDEHGGIAWQTSAPTEAHAASIARRNGKVTPLAPVAALASPAPSVGEPVAWMMKWPNHLPSFTTDKSDYVTWLHGRASYPDELIPLYATPPAAPAAPSISDLLCRWFDQAGERDRGDGNAPGHGHDVPGIWDSDNGAKAGTACALCALWAEAKKARATPPAAPAATEAPSESLRQFAEAQRPLPTDMAAILDAYKWDLYALATPAPAVGATMTDAEILSGLYEAPWPTTNESILRFARSLLARAAVGASVQPVQASLSDEQIAAIAGKYLTTAFVGARQHSGIFQYVPFARDIIALATTSSAAVPASEGGAS